MPLLRWVLFALVFNTAVASAADDKSLFAMKGAGFLPCQIYVNERATKSNIYYMIGGWLEGYITAHNKYVEDTYDVASFESLELLLNVLENHCKSNPTDNLYSVINSLITKISVQRLREESDRVEIEEDGRKTILYRETIRRIQAELTRLGLFQDPVDGRYTDATKSAIIAFQSDLDYEMTGFPDQTTLWRLLRK